MKRLILTTIFLFTVLASIMAQDQNIQKEQELIKKVIQEAYVDGLCNYADEAAVTKGFHPGFSLIGVGRGNTMWKNPIYNWIESAKAGKKEHKYSFQDEFTTVEYQFIDVTGSAAVAKIDFYEGGIKKFVDYISLLKFEDGWKIVSKTFYALPKIEDQKEK